MDEKIFRSDSAPERLSGSSPKVLKREVYEATREARDVVALAQEKAKQIIDDAMRERDAIRAQGRQEGNAQGLAEWNEILARMTERAEELTKNWEETMLRLSVGVAQKIIGEQLRLDPGMIVKIVGQVLKGTRTGKNVTIQVNESEAQQLRSRLDYLKQFLAGGSEIEVVGTASMPPGGCVIESELGIIDARLETQLKCLEDVLMRGSSTD